jgi:hypothetical protein
MYGAALEAGLLAMAICYDQHDPNSDSLRFKEFRLRMIRAAALRGFPHRWLWDTEFR